MVEIVNDREKAAKLAEGRRYGVLTVFSASTPSFTVVLEHEGSIPDDISDNTADRVGRQSDVSNQARVRLEGLIRAGTSVDEAASQVGEEFGLALICKINGT